MTLEVRWQSRAADCAEAVWQAGFPPPWEGRWWFEALERGALEDQFRFLYAEVLDAAGRVIAIAPAFLMDLPLEMFVPEPLVPLIRPAGRVFPSLLVQRTLFYGSPCSERGWIGLASAVPTAMVPLILEALDVAAERKARELGAAMRVWKDFPAAFQDALAGIARRRGLFTAPSFPGTAVTLPPGGKEAYFLSIKPSRRQQLRRKLRNSRAAVALTCELVAQPDENLLAQLFALFWQTYEHASTRFERLNLQVFRAFAEAASTAFIVLREPIPAPADPDTGAPPQAPDASRPVQAGAPVAFMMVYVDGPLLINKFIGLDYARPREWLLYFRLWEAAVEVALHLDKRGIESGQTGYRAKIAVGHELLPLWNWCRHRNPLLHLVYRLVAARIDWAALDPELAALAADPANHGIP